MPGLGSLELVAEVTTPSGRRYRWDANQPDPGSRPLGWSFGTKIGEGFSAASLRLPRRIDQDYPDLDLGHTVTLLGADGSVAYEGRIEAMPRSLDTSHSISVTLAGWMAHLRDKPFAKVYVDRDLSAWGVISTKRRANLLASSFHMIEDAQLTTDPVFGEAGLTTGFTGAWSSPFKPITNAIYDAGPNGAFVNSIYYSWRIFSGISPADTNWQWNLSMAGDPEMTVGLTSTANLRAAGPVNNAEFAATGLFRYAMIQLQYNNTPAGAAGSTNSLLWKRLAAYGDSSFPRYTGDPSEPPGVLASDVVKDIVQTGAPMLNTAGVQPTSYVIQHLAFKDLIDPYDALLAVNAFHQWHLGVWEDRTLHFRPYDLVNADWEIRTDDPGVTLDLQGPSTESLYNGVIVTYADLLTGVMHTLTPSTDSALGDPSTENPWNEAGISRWKTVAASRPLMRADAVQFGRMALADINRPKTPGTITVTGHIRDRAGTSQPVWKIRAGDTITLSNFPNDSVRLIVETDYSDDQKQIRLAIDRPFQLLEALLDRQQTALAARGIAV